MRRTSTTINTTVPFTTNYGYKSVGNNTSTQLASIWYSNSDAFNYTYDANGNITAITHPAGYEIVRYYYDALNQLIREDNFELNKSVTYTYDNGGNIRSVKEYAYTTGALGAVTNEKTYSYTDASWKDLLTNYNGVSIEYDAIGNPRNWINGESFTWVDGRRLSTVTKGSNTFNYAYNEDGIRTSKTINGIRTDYYLNGTAIIMQKTGDNCIWYTYDENGLVSGFRYNGNEYYYFRNGQSDIIGIIDSSGSTVARYTYDSWGNHVSITDGNGNNVASNPNHIANINPLRYKGYYYDTETGLYYLNSRYYDANVGRFINADVELSEIGGNALGYNLFAYCFNNPINMDDLAGEWPKWLSGALNVVSGIVQMATGSALGAFAGWTGVGAIAAGFLITNGAASIAQGVGQIVNDVTNSNVMREDNMLETAFEDIGHAIGGETGAEVASGVYDVSVVAASIYSAKVIADNTTLKEISSKVFSGHDGYGFKVGKNIEILYKNPKATGGVGGTIFSYKGPLRKFRIDWDIVHGFHSHPPGHKK